MPTALNLKSITGLTLGIFIAVQLLMVGSVLLIPKPVEAWVFPNIELGSVYQVLKDIAAGILYSLAMNFIQKFMTKFTNKLTQKYKIRNYLYYDQVLMNYYLTNYISDKVSDPNLKKIYNLMNANFITGQSTGYSGQLDPRLALIPQLKKAISDEYIRSGGVPTETIYNPPRTMTDSEYFSAAQQYFYNPPSFTEQNLRGNFGAMQSNATTAAQLEVIVGNGLKAGRLIGGTCKTSYEQEKLSPFALLLNKLNIVQIAHAEDPPPLPSTPLPGGNTAPLPTAPTGNQIPPAPSTTDGSSGPEACKQAGGTWQPSALDKARSFIDNPASFIDGYLQQGISKVFGKFDPNKLSVVVGSLIGNIIFNQFALDKTTGTLNEDPQGYNPSDSPTSNGTEIDIDGDGISDGVDIDKDNIPDICTYGGVDGGAGPPCKGSKTAYSAEPVPVGGGGATICASDEVSVDVVYHVASGQPASGGASYDRLSVHVSVPGAFSNPGPDLVDDDALHIPPEGSLLSFANISLNTSGGAGAYTTAGPYEAAAAQTAGKDRHTVVPDPSSWVDGMEPGIGFKRIDLNSWKGSNELVIGGFFRSNDGDGRAEVCTPLSNVAELFRTAVTDLAGQLPR